MAEYGTHTGLEKLSMTSKNVLEDNKAKIAQLFPQVVTESRDTDGKLRQMIDFDKLKDLLSDELTEGRESYEFTWVGKREAMAEAGRPTTKTLRPDLEESVNFDETGNVFISGDNLEVLKILQESYLNKIDMIYIDPPYNTGKDFVYADNFAMTQDDLDEAMDGKDEMGQRLFKNEKSNARYHSDWLNMMYPRLVLARNLLKESGVIFISIDDNEQANLKQLCDEVFGEENFVGSLPTIMNMKGNNDQFGFAGTHEFTIVYCKNRAILVDLNGIPLDNVDIKEYRLEDEFGKYKKGATLMRTGEAGERRFRPKGYYPIYVTHDLSNMSLVRTSENDFEVFPKTTSGKEMSWRRSPDKLQETIQEFIITQTQNGISFYKKQRLSEMMKLGKKAKTLLYKPEYSSGNGTARVVELLGSRLFDNPKPTTLIRDLVSIGGDSDSLILDFFAGSGTTADAVMQLNAEDGGNRKYIVCTLDEEVNEKSAAKEAGYEMIDQISRERIRRAAKKIKEENPDKAASLDFGFRAYRLDSSNYKDVYLTPDATQQDLFGSVSNIKEGRTGLDLLHQVMLTWGMPLDLTIETETVGQATIYNVDDDSLIACFDKVDEAIVRKIAQQQPLRAIFLDESFTNSSDKINVSEIFKELSPETKVKVV